jgi:hypothetical protein
LQLWVCIIPSLFSYFAEKKKMISESGYYTDLASKIDFVPEISSGEYTIPGINGHIHSPYSFSAFRNMEEPFEIAVKEGISVLGINDFYTTDGYAEFADLAKKYSIFPLFNIEFMALLKQQQENGIRINDPVNPGRTYLSGKGLTFPVKVSVQSREKLEILQNESNAQTYQMVEKLNGYLKSISSGLHFDAAEIQKRFARNLLRERHIATAIRTAVFEKENTPDAILNSLTRIFGNKAPKSSTNQIAYLENEIRNNLLKAGGPAYVPEDEKAFLSLEEVTGLIIDAGGIPCYPVLLDDAKGNFTDFEKDWPKMADLLMDKGIFMVELIPGRNDFAILKEFVSYFHHQGFPVTFGTEHNTPQLDPLTVTCRGGVPPDRELQEISYKGVSVIAAHQYLTARGYSGFPTGHFPALSELKELEELGMKVISAFTQSPIWRNK